MLIRSMFALERLPLQDGLPQVLPIVPSALILHRFLQMHLGQSSLLGRVAKVSLSTNRAVMLYLPRAVGAEPATTPASWCLIERASEAAHLIDLQSA